MMTKGVPSSIMHHASCIMHHDPENKDNLKNENDLKNEDDLKNRDDRKNGDDLKK